MKTNNLGQVTATDSEIVEFLYANPHSLPRGVCIEAADKVNCALHELDLEEIFAVEISADAETAALVHKQRQQTWFMPKEYATMDIAEWCLQQCSNDTELQRVGEELLLYYNRGFEHMLRYIKYLVDTMRANNIMWGVGRGSSVASFVLYLIGIHSVNSIEFELDIREFLR